MSKQKGKRESKEWPCQRCGDCCTIVPISKSVLSQNREKFQRPIIEEREITVEGDLTGYFSIITNDGYCAFLSPDRLCVIYDQRPEICRDFGRKGGFLECQWVTRSGRVRSPEDAKKALERIQKFQDENADENITRDVMGVVYRRYPE